MKKIFATLLIIGTLAAMFPFETFGQTYRTRRIQRNGRWQTTRIYVGRTNNWNNRGRVTPQEYRRLSRQRYNIYRQRNRITRDGYVTRQEARRYNRNTNRYYRNVRRARNW